jgi:hypothetical protein
MLNNDGERKKQLYLEYKLTSLEELWFSYCEVLNLVGCNSCYIDESLVIYDLILNKDLAERLKFQGHLENLLLEYRKKLNKTIGQTFLAFSKLYPKKSDNQILKLVLKDRECISAERMFKEIVSQKRIFDNFVFQS